MQKLSCLLAACLMLGATVHAKECLVNGSFEEGDGSSPKGWTGSEGARWEDGGRSGKCAVLGPAPKPEAWVTWKQEIKDFQPNMVYQFSCWVKADKPGVFAQVLIDGLKPHKANSDYFYTKADTEWKLWKKDVVGDASSAPVVHVTLLNEGGPNTFYFDDVSFKTRETGNVKAEPVKKAPEVDVFREGGNLVSNGEVEKGEGDRPAGWSHTNPGLMPVNSAGLYHFAPAEDKGEYAWEQPGYQSDHCVSVKVKPGEGWGGWNTQIHNIKSNTDYTINFWLRLDAVNARLLMFGKEFQLRNYFAKTPWHWSMFSKTVNSGNFAGDCNIGFAAEGEFQGVGKMSVDRVQLFEGTSPVGKNAAWMYHYLYDFTYVSPDVVATVAFAGEWQFEKDKQPPGIRYVIEIPKEVECTGVYIGRVRHVTPWRMVWTNPDPEARVEKGAVQREGKEYLRYTVHQKQLTSTDAKGFANECFVPVDLRGLANPDTRNRYGAVNFLWMYLITKQASGEIAPAYYHAEWDGGKTPETKLGFKVTRIAEVPQPKRMYLFAGYAPQAPKLNPQFLSDYKRLGLNGFHGSFATLKDESLGQQWLAEAKNAGMKYFSHDMNMPMYNIGDPEAKGAGIDGSRNTKNWCLEYCGKDWNGASGPHKFGLNLLKGAMDKGVNTFFFDDYQPSICYCEKCKGVFKEFLKKHSKLEYIDPSVFMKPDWKGDEKYKQLWNDFTVWHYGITAGAIKKELVEHGNGMKPPMKVYLGTSSYPRFKEPFAGETFDCLEFVCPQTYICCYYRPFGTPLDVGKSAEISQKMFGKYARPYVPFISPGLTYYQCLLGIVPHVMMKDQIMEMMMAAPKAMGYICYAGRDFDLGDMKYTAEANKLLSRFEDIIADGEIVDGVEAHGTKETSVRVKKLAGAMLVLVGDYSTYEPKATEVSFKLPGVAQLTDTENGAVVKPDADNTFRVTLKETRQRLFQGGEKR